MRVRCIMRIFAVGMIMITCPSTGHAISTGMETDAASFRRSPVFFGRTHCPHCQAMHQWFAMDAWVDETCHQTLDNGPVATSFAADPPHRS